MFYICPRKVRRLVLGGCNRTAMSRRRLLEQVGCALTERTKPELFYCRFVPLKGGFVPLKRGLVSAGPGGSCLALE